jgi:hypothetical protein
MSVLIQQINNIGIIMSIIIIIIFILLTEVGSYVWHRFATHRDIIPTIIGVQNTHDTHHQEEIKHSNDFFYIAIILIIYALFLKIIQNITGLSLYISLLIYCPVFILFVWNWYVHNAYHTKNHWLQQYDWFIKDKKIHFQHHYDPEQNYGIASHFTDIFLGTFNPGLNRNEDNDLYYKE